MSKFHQRVVCMSWVEGSTPEFTPEVLQAIGRAVVYDLQGVNYEPGHDTIQLVNMAFVDKGQEFDTCYYPPVKARNEPDENGFEWFRGSPNEIMSTFVGLMMEKSKRKKVVDGVEYESRPFVLGCVKHRDGGWSFHS